MAGLGSEKVVESLLEEGAAKRAHVIPALDDYDFQVAHHAVHRVDASFERVFVADDCQHGHFVVLELFA